MTTADPAAGETGFTLIEALVSVGLIATAMAVAFGAVTSLATVSIASGNRGLAQRTARNILTRARAAGAYYPKPADPQATTLPQDYSNPQNLPFKPSAAYALQVPYAIAQPSGTPLLRNVALHVTTGFMPARPGTGVAGTFSVKVEYPSANGGTGTVDATEELPAPSFIPGTRVRAAIAEPMRQ